MLQGTLARWMRLGTLGICLTTLPACASIPMEHQDSRLALQRGGLSGFKYTMDDSEPEGVYNFWGNYNPEFTGLLSSDPIALAEAKKAEGFMYASLGVTLVSAAYSFRELYRAATIDNSTLGGLTAQDQHLQRAVGGMLGGVILSSVLRIPTRDHLYNAVGAYNAGLDSDEDGDGEGPSAMTWHPNALSVDPMTGRVGIGWRIAH